MVGTNQSDFVSEWYLSIADVKALSNSGMGIGSHTCSHNLLSSVSEDKLRFELRNSKNFLENVTQERVTEFCYPFGGKLSYNRNTLEELSKAGFTVAHSVESRRIIPSDFTTPLELPRYDCNEFPFGTARSTDLI